jgi:hypothetical protein
MNIVFGLLVDVVGEEKARQVVTTLAVAGYVCVPLKPTKEMIEAAYWPSHAENTEGIWDEMIKAALGGEETL